MISRHLGCRRGVVACVALELLGIGLGTLGPVLLKQLVDRTSSHLGDAWLWFDMVAFVIAWTGTTYLAALRNVYSTRINGVLTEHLITSATRGYLEAFQPGQEDSGKTLGAIERLPYSLTVVVDGFIWRTAPLALQFALSLAVILQLMSWRYLLILICLAAGFLGVSWYGARRHSLKAAKWGEANAANAGLLGDILRNSDRVVCNGAIDHEIEAIRSTLIARSRDEVALSRSLASLSGNQYAVIALGMFILLLLAALDVGRGAILIGDFVLLQAYGLRLTLPLAAAGFTLSQSATAIANIAEVLAMRREVSRDSSSPAVRAGRPAGVSVASVSFAYNPTRSVVRDVSADFQAASFSVIVGKNGSGKSTLAKLIAGRLSPTSGSVLHDGQNLSNIPLGLRHKRVLYVAQRAGILNRSLRANLEYPPSREHADVAAQRLRDWDFYEASPDIDLDLLLGEGGANLSGGQTQKMELARVAGIEVPCLILDESTSAMDPASEQKVLASLRATLGIATTLILVTHRDAVAKAADQVFWMVEGRLAAVGEHEELMQKFAGYRALWREEIQKDLCQ